MEQIIKIDEIDFKEELYPRISVNYITVGNYADKMKAGVKFPPIVVGKINGETILVDGYHRLLAIQRLDEEYIKAEIKQYGAVVDLFEDAVELNSSHGLPLTSSDNVKILATLEKMKFEPLHIGELIKATSDRMQKYQDRILRRPDGSQIFLKAPIARLLAKGHITEEEAMNVDQKWFAVQDVKQIIVQLIALLQGGVYPWGDSTMKALAVEAYQLLGRNITINDIS